jgi:single stranded DNA-binding protein (ssb)
MNRIQLMGRLTRDPEVRYTQTGRAVASFSVAVRRYTGPNSQNRDETDFIDVVAWGVLAESCGNTLQKGQMVLVDGRLQIRSYEAKDGQTRRVSEVVANSVSQPLDSWERRDGGSSEGASAPARQSQSAVSSFGSEVLPDEDIPF